MSEGIIVNYLLKNSYKLQAKLVKLNTLPGLQDSYLTSPAISSGCYSSCSCFSSIFFLVLPLISIARPLFFFFLHLHTRVMPPRIHISAERLTAILPSDSVITQLIFPLFSIDFVRKLFSKLCLFNSFWSLSRILWFFSSSIILLLFSVNFVMFLLLNVGR